MNWIVYFGIALIALESDAVICWATKKKFNIFGGLIMALIWPVTAPLIIISVIREQ